MLPVQNSQLADPDMQGPSVDAQRVTMTGIVDGWGQEAQMHRMSGVMYPVGAARDGVR
jgi:hypothetical protein